MNWQEIIKELAESGLTQVAIATRCGISQSMVSDLARGTVKQPGYSSGTALLALLAESQRAQKPGAPSPEARAA